MPDVADVERGQFLLAQKLWPKISDKTRVFYTIYNGIRFPVMSDPYYLHGRPIYFRNIEIRTEAHTGGYMGYSAEIDTLVMRRLITQ